MLIFSQIIFLIIFALFSVFAFYFFISVFTGAPYVGTPAQKLKVMLDLAQITPGVRVVDLGSGDGRLVIAAAKKGAKAEGVEINPGLWAYSRLKLIFSGKLPGSAYFQWGSLYDVDFSLYEVIFVAGFVGMMKKLEKRFKKDLRPGTKVICYAFPLLRKRPLYARDGVYLYEY